MTLGPDGEGFAWGLARLRRTAPSCSRRCGPAGIHLLRNQQLEIRSGATRLASALAERLSSRSSSRLRLRRARRGRSTPPRARTGRSRPSVAHERHARRPRRSPEAATSRRGSTSRSSPRRSRPPGLDVAGPVEPGARPRRGGDPRRSSRSTPTRRPTPRARRTATRSRALVAPGGMGESIRVLLASRGTALGSTLASWPRHK